MFMSVGTDTTKAFLARQDVYAWKATAQFSNGHRVTKAGDVTLIVQ